MANTRQADAHPTGQLPETAPRPRELDLGRRIVRHQRQLLGVALPIIGAFALAEDARRETSLKPIDQLPEDRRLAVALLSAREIPGD